MRQIETHNYTLIFKCILLTISRSPMKMVKMRRLKMLIYLNLPRNLLKNRIRNRITQFRKLEFPVIEKSWPSWKLFNLTWMTLNPLGTHSAHGWSCKHRNIRPEVILEMRWSLQSQSYWTRMTIFDFWEHKITLKEDKIDDWPGKKWGFRGRIFCRG